MISLPKLKEPKLFQWALAYAACAWTLFQMLALLADTFHWPDVVAQVATVILGVGFFAALLLAWYPVTGARARA